MPLISAAPENVALRPGSLILITGVTGYIGAHIADQLLLRGYRVRGIVRRPSEWLTNLFAEKYGEGVYTTYFVPDLSNEELLVPAMKDVQGVIHVASDVSFTPDPNIVVPIAVNLATAALKAAAAAHSSSVQRFILTSSAAAASAYAPNIPRTVTSSSWSTSYMAEAKKPGPYGPERGLSSYGASKALAEKAIWEWVAGNKGKSPLVVNTVLPDFNLGLPISPENQGWPSTAGMAVALFNGDVKNGRLTPPQHFVAVQDTALLHVAALLHPNVRNQRIFGLAEPKNANDILRILKELYPQRSFAEEDPDEGQDLVKVVEKDRAEELLVWIAGKKWTSLRDSVKEVGDYLIAHEKSS